MPPKAWAGAYRSELDGRKTDRLNRSLFAGRPRECFVYNDRGSLVSLRRYSTVGSLMGNLIGGRLAIEGRLARIAYISLYRLHLAAIHGWIRGIALIAIGHVNRIARPKLKVH